MNGEESSREKTNNFKAKITFNMKSQHDYQLLFARIIIFIGYRFFLAHAHPKFVYKLDINNHKTVSNEKDMNNLFN